MGTLVINLPDVGEGIAEAELTEWNVAVGDMIQEDDVLGSVMTDKAAVEVPSSVTGKIIWLCGEPGDMIAIGSKFVEIEISEDGEDADLEPAANDTKASLSKSDTATEIIDVILPDVGEGIAEAEIAEWNVAVGDIVQEEDILGAVMTDKATVEVPSVYAGKIVWLAGEVGEKIAIGSPFVQLEATGQIKAYPQAPAVEPAQSVQTSPPPRPTQKGSEGTAHRSKPLASPSVRQAAHDQGISLLDVAGTGPAGRISHQDLADHVNQPRSPRTSRVAATGKRDFKVVGMRRQIAKKMALSKARIPHITIVEEIDVTELESLREKLNKSYADERGKLTILPFIAAAISAAVRKHPEMNAIFDDEQNIVTQYDAVHIGIAAQTPAGLTVPVVKHAEANSLWDTASDINRLSQAARDGKAALSDLTGATITISSLGPLGALATTPIINHPEVAIVGVNKMAIRPMWNGDNFEPRKMMNLSCSFDHRVIDGWDAAMFVKALKDLLETPALLFVEA